MRKVSAIQSSPSLLIFLVPSIGLLNSFLIQLEDSTGRK